MKRKQFFIIDAMLAKLGRWLRLFGLKLEIMSNNLDDDAILKKCIKSNATLVTRDELLFQRAKDYVNSILLKKNDLNGQLKEFSKKVKLNLKTPLNFSICTKCGGKLKRVKKAVVKNKVFPKVYKFHKLFWQCENCKQVYWKGSHLKGIAKRLKLLK